MEQEELFGDGVDSVRIWQANVLCCLSTLSFYVMGEILTKKGKPKYVAVDVEFWKWRNIFISWLHGIICGIWDGLCVMLYPDLLRDPVAYINKFMYLMVPFSAGYFIYDFIDMMLNDKLQKYWEVTLHHCIIVSSFIYNWNIKRCIGYNVIALMAEINSIFLHLRKLLQMCNVGFKTKLYRFVSLTNLFTFITCRLIPISRVFIGLYFDFHRVSLTYIVMFSFTVTTGFVINIILFWRLVKADILKGLLGIGKSTMSMVDKTIVVNGNNNPHDS